jgi:DNA ligase D-like protein (predicted polymerase)
VQLPAGKDAVIELGDRQVRLTNLDKPFWPDAGIVKRDLLQYYADVAHVLLPHLADRAMVMKRYPDGAAGEPFFMKRAPSPRPAWIETCAIEHASGSVIDFPMIQDLASLLWVVNLGCIDLNPWYARCDDVDRPDVLHFDLDPVPEATYAGVVETARLVRTALQGLGMQPLVKTTGSRGLHVYVAIVRGPTQKEVWRFAKRFAFDIAALRPEPDHGRVPHRQAAGRAHPGRLQPERLGPHAGLGLLAAAAAAGHRVGADHVGRARCRGPHRRLRSSQHAGADRCGGRPVGAAARAGQALRPRSLAARDRLNGARVA